MFGRLAQGLFGWLMVQTNLDFLDFLDRAMFCEYLFLDFLEILDFACLAGWLAIYPNAEWLVGFMVGRMGDGTTNLGFLGFLG